jgi:hypothetical protein
MMTSTNSKHLISERARHYVHLETPDILVTALKEISAQVEQSQPQ